MLKELIMNSVILHLVRIIVIYIPETRGFKLKRFLYRLAGAKIGENVRICSSVTIYGSGNLSIGKNTWIGHKTTIISSSSITIGENIDIGPEVYIGTGSHVIDLTSPNIAGEGISKNVNVKDGSWLGARCIILPGVEIGSKSIVAAGTVVNNTFPEYSFLAGLPAKLKKKLI